MHKTGQSGVFLGRPLVPLLKNRLPLIENVLKLLAKSVSIPLGLTAAASALDAAIHKKMFGFGVGPRTLALHLSNLAKRTTLIMSDEE